jgi:hypothetical protein
VANLSRFDSFEPRHFLPEDVREYQIRRTRFPGGRWKLKVDLMTPAQPEWKTTAWPAGTRSTDTKGWITLELD